MKKHNRQAMWLVLPALLVVLYFVIFQPQPGGTSARQLSSAVNSPSGSAEPPVPLITTNTDVVHRKAPARLVMYPQMN